MKKIGIIIASLLICSISYAGYVTIEEEKIAIGDGTKVVDKLPMGTKVELISETNNRYIIKYDDKIAEVNKECLRFSQNEQPSISPYSGHLQKVYEVSLELNKGEEYKVIKEDKTKYLVAYQLKKTAVVIWIEKNLVSYKEFSKLEEEQIAKGLVKYKEGEWITPEEFSKREKEIIKLRADEFNAHRKILDEYILNLAGFRSDSSKMTKSEILQKYGEDFEFRTLAAIDNEIEYCLKCLEQMGEYESAEYNTLSKINKIYKNELENEFDKLEQEAKGLVKYQGKWVTPEKSLN